MAGSCLEGSVCFQGAEEDAKQSKAYTGRSTSVIPLYRPGSFSKRQLSEVNAVVVTRHLGR